MSTFHGYDFGSGGRMLPHKRRRLLLKKAKPDSKITNFLLPQSLPPYIKNFIEQNKDVPISSMRVCRTPIPGALEKLANIATLGQYEKNKIERNIDRFFHLFMYIILENSKIIIYEKNQRITLFETYKRIDGTEANCIHVPNARGLKFGEMVQRGIQFCGASNYFIYEMTTNNCQQFVYCNLYPSGLWNPQIQNFVKQNVENIVPSWIQKLMKFGTNIAHLKERITGFSPNIKWTQGEQFEHPILEKQRQLKEGEEIAFEGEFEDIIRPQTFKKPLGPPTGEGIFHRRFTLGGNIDRLACHNIF